MMARHLFNVAETCDLPGRGVVIITDRKYEELSSLRVRIGDDVEFRHDGIAVKSSIAGVEHLNPWTPQTGFAFLIPPDATRPDIPTGSEVWIADF
jgi:hypothetical protein